MVKSDLLFGSTSRKQRRVRGVRKYTQELSVCPRTAGLVRRVVTAHLRYWGREELCDAILLCLTEMLTNVGKHAGTLHCVLTLEDIGHGVRLTVSDASPQTPSVCDHGLLAESGRGMRLIAATATRFGCDVTPAGKDFWAVFTGRAGGTS